MSTAPEFVFDAAVAYPEIGVLRAALARRDWTAARAVADAAAPALRSGLVHDGGDQAGVEEFLRYVHGRHPEDSFAGALLGSRLIKIGWGIRTAARAKNVSRQQFTAFHDWLRQAEQVLIDAAARHPNDPAVWVQRLITARGLELGLSEVRRRYDRLARIDPNHLPGQLTMLQSLCPKWSGSWEQAHAFARECMLNAPPGTLSAVVVAEAHLEHWLDLASGEDLRYLKSDAVRAELYEAANRSVWHPHFRPAYGWVGAVHTFAMLFSLIDDDLATTRLFAQAGHLATAHPWDYLGDPAQQIRTHRAAAQPRGAARR